MTLISISLSVLAKKIIFVECPQHTEERKKERKKQRKKETKKERTKSTPGRETLFPFAFKCELFTPPFGPKRANLRT